MKEVVLGNTKAKAREESGSRQQHTRQQKVQAVRSQPVLDVDADASQTLELLELLAGGMDKAVLTLLSTPSGSGRKPNCIRVRRKKPEKRRIVKAKEMLLRHPQRKAKPIGDRK